MSLSPLPVVYVVEDDEGVRTALRRYLGQCGFAVRGYETGDDFLAEVQAPEMGCLLLDLDLPGLSGFEVLELVRSRKWALPVIILTGTSNLLLKEQALQSGARAYLRKPIEPQLLLAAIQDALVVHAS